MVDTDPIASLRSPEGALASVYVHRPAPGGMAALLTDLGRRLRDLANGRDRTVEKSARSDADRLHDLADELEFDAAPAYAVFASHVNDIFEVESLPHPVESYATLGPRPYLRPLRAAPKPLRSGVLVADRALTRVFVVGDGHIEEMRPPLEADIGKPNFGGFSGYAEHRVRQHADEETARMWRDAGRRLLDFHTRRALDHLAIGGHEETTDEIAAALHPYLARLPRTTFVANPKTLTLSGLRAALADQVEEIRTQRQLDLAERVCATARAGGLAVLGLNATLEAANAQAVEHLAVAGPFRRAGVLCDNCGHLARSGSSCPVCGSRMFSVEDIVAALMESVIGAGGKVDQLEVASQLDVDGIAGLIRFPLRG